MLEVDEVSGTCSSPRRRLDVLERLRIRDAGEDHLGAVIRDDRRRVVAPVDGVDLGHVLEDRHELDALTGAGRGERCEVAERRDVGALVEDEQQRRVEWPPGLGRAVVGVGDDLLYESGEQWLEAALLVSRRAEVGGVPAAVEEPVGAEFGRHRRREHAGVDVGDQHRLGGRVDAASRSVVPERDRLEGVERLLLVVRFERSLDAARLPASRSSATTCAIVPPLQAAASRIGASSLAVAPYQKSAASLAERARSGAAGRASPRRAARPAR